MFNPVTLTLQGSKKQLTRVYTVSHRQQNYEHDYTRIKFREWGLSPKHIKPGKLVTININGKDFHGYIHDVKSHQENQKNFTELGIIGASYVMRQASQKVYKNVTADQVVKIIAKKYGFAYKLTPHPRVYPHISQAGLTDWELMVKLAKQCGYFLRAESTSLYFQPLLQDFEDLILECKSFIKADGGHRSPNLMYSFKPIVGETLAHHGADKSATSIAGIDPKTGKKFKYTKQKRGTTTRKISNPEFFDKHDTFVVANDYKTAVSEANSADDKSRFPYSAEVEVIGTVNLRPGMPIYLDNVGEEYSGYWTILTVNHTVVEKSLNNHIYTSILTVGTDSLGEIASTKVPVKPLSKPIRLIKPNVKNTRSKPRSIVKSPGIIIKPTAVKRLVAQTNRAPVAGKTVSNSTWVSTHGDLNKVAKIKAPSAAAKLKAVSTLARQ